MGLVDFKICEGNPGALTFMLKAYEKNPWRAEMGFQRMRDNGITGSKLYMLWNDCCGKNTEAAVMIMNENDIEDIRKHINYESGRGIPYEKSKVTEG